MTEENRLPTLRPAELSPEQRRLCDALTTGARGSAAGGIEVAADGALAGPFNAMLHHPGVGDPLQALGAALRYAGVLTVRCRELAVLLVAAHHRSGYEWHAHVPIARRAGFTDAQLEQVLARCAPDMEDPAERAVVAAVRALLKHGDLDDGAYRSAADTLGDAALVELTALVGYYALLALQLRVFRVPLPPGASEVDFNPDGGPITPGRADRQVGRSTHAGFRAEWPHRPPACRLTTSDGQSTGNGCFPPSTAPP
jgi:4-carboxymuconolactone decarboxylase